MARKSLQDRIRQRKQSNFVGRESQLGLFRKTVQNPLVEDGDRCFDQLIFNIWGQGGVGKSTLLGQFQQIAQGAGFAVVSMDEGIKALPEMLGRFAEQLVRQGLVMRSFSERYKTYREKREELEADPEAPQGFAAFLGKTVTRTGLRLAKKVPLGGDALEELVDDQVLVEQGGEWASYLSRKLKNKDEVVLLREPERVLTQLFLKDLEQVAQQRDILFCFDTYEETDRFLDDWLRALLTGEQYGGMPTNVVMAVAGRAELDWNLWADLGDWIVRLPLEAFTEEEAEGFLSRKGVTDGRVVAVILEISGRLPLLMATLAEASPENADSVGDPSGTAVERFLKWVDDPVQRQLALDAALPRQLDQDIVACLAGEERAEELFAWLKERPFVKERSDGWVYHEVVRSQMLRYLRKRSERDWKERHQKLVAYFAGQQEALQLSEDEAWKDEPWQKHKLEWLYHQLCVAKDQGLAEAINGFLHALRMKQAFAGWWAALMIEAGKCCEAGKTLEWGERLSGGLRAYDDEDYGEATAIFTAVLECPELQEETRKIALAKRGEIYQLDLQYEASLQDLNQAIELDAEYQWAFNQRGITYQQMERYEEAIADYDRAIELDPKCKSAIGLRGYAHNLLKSYEQAISDFTRVIELDGEFKESFILRGSIYQEIDRHEEAILDFSTAIKLDPEGSSYAISLRGLSYEFQGLYQQAIEDFSQAIKLDSKTAFLFYRRGHYYRITGYFDKAIDDYSCAIDIDPDYALAFASRGYIHQLLENYNQSVLDFDRAIDIDPEYKWAIKLRGYTYQLMERYEDAVFDYDRATKIDSEDQWVLILKGQTQRLMRHYEEALATLEGVLKISPEHHLTIQYQAELYLLTSQPQIAVSRIAHAFELDSDCDYNYYIRALTNLALKNIPAAQADLTRAIQLTQQFFDEHEATWWGKFYLPLYYLVAQNPQRAKALYQKVFSENPPLATIKEAIRNLEDLLTILPNYPNAQNFLNALQKELQKRQNQNNASKS